MRQLVLSMFVSVDGFIEGPAGEFIGPTGMEQFSGRRRRF
jgi:hypothetical protein